MPQQIEVPGIGIVEFPDGMSDDQIADAIRRNMPTQDTAQASAEPSPGALQGVREMLGAGTSGISQGLTFGFGDELFAGIETPFRVAGRAIMGGDEGKGIGERFSSAYDAALEAQRSIDKRAREQHPGIATAGEVAGGLVTGGGLAKGGFTLMNAAKPTIPSMIGRGAAEGAAYGGLYGLGTGEGTDDRLDKAASGAALGALVGGPLGGVGAKMAKSAQKAAIPSTEQLKNYSHAAYDLADQAGVIVSPQSWNGAVRDIARKVANEGIDPTLHPQAVAALKRFAEVANDPITFKSMDILRQIAKDAAGSNSPGERRIASIMIDKLDDYMANLKPGDVLKGDAELAIGALQEARSAWGRMRKGEMLEGLIERATIRAGQYSQSGMENALRTEFRQLAMNPKRLRGFSDEERKAIMKVARGGPVENALRLLGKFAPRGVVSALPSMGMAAGVDMGAGAALAIAGEAGKRSAAAMTSANAQRAADLARSGGQMPALQQISGPQRAALQALLLSGSQQIPQFAPPLFNSRAGTRAAVR